MILIILVPILLLIVFFIVLLFFRIYITIEYLFSENEQQLDLSVTIFRLLVINRTIPLSKGITSNSFLDDLDSLESFFEKDHSWIQWKDAILQLLKKIHLHDLNWTTTVGTGEAASTGIVTGLLWTTKSSLLALMTSNMKLIQSPEIDVSPVYQGQVIQTSFQCKISIQLKKAIRGFIQVRRILK